MKCSGTVNCSICLLGYYRDCKEAHDRELTCSGVYTIKPDNLPPFEAYCDMETDGGGWTVFQRRMDGSQDFFLNWSDYVRGFGELNREFWLGLSQLERLTKTPTELRVDLEDFDNDARFAKYSTFKVGDSASNYTLTVSGYSGTAGNPLTYHSNQEFSTKDHDNDVSYHTNCAERYKGGWWYRSCHSSNLNGLYLSGPRTSSGEGIKWFRGHRYSLKFSEMKLRRV